jgi:hypothetical protein
VIFVQNYPVFIFIFTTTFHSTLPTQAKEKYSRVETVRRKNSVAFTVAGFLLPRG